MIFLVWLFLSSCRHSATQLVFHDQHVLTLNGKKQVCRIEIRSDPEEPALWGDPNAETSLRLSCEEWRMPFTRELNSCLVEKSGAYIRWLPSEKSVLLQLQSVPDHGGSPTTYLWFDFEKKRLQSDLYGLPAAERCDGDCYQALAEKAAAYGIARKP